MKILFSRHLVGLIGLIVLALLVGACGQAAAPAPAPAAPSAKATDAPKAAAPAAGPPQRGGVTVIAIDSDPETLNLGTTTSNTSGDVGAKILEGLVYLDPTMTPQGELATSWEISPDGKTYTFTLRPNVTWHDGKPFTSADVKFTFDEILAKFHPRTQSLMKQRVESVEAPDPLKVVIKLKEPFAPFLTQMTVFDAPILPKHLYEGTDILKNDYNLKPVGTGPFKFSEWARGSQVKLVRNDKYWGEGKPYLDGVNFQVIPQGPNRSTSLETGETDFVLDFYLPKADAKRLLANPNLQSKRGQGFPAIDFVTINTQTPALSKPEARQALAMAIDRKRLVEQSMGGIGRPGKGPWGDGFPWMLTDAADFDKLYPRDVEKAKALLDKAGVTAGADGSRGKLRLVYDAARPQFVSGGQIIKENLKDIGFDVELQPLERAVMIDKVFANRDYDLTLQSYVSSGDPAIGYHRLYLTNTTKTQFLNASGWGSEQVDGLLNKAAVTPDRDARGKLYQEAAVILAQQLPSIVLFDEEGMDIATKKLNNLWTVRDSRDGWENAWLTK